MKELPDRLQFLGTYAPEMTLRRINPSLLSESKVPGSPEIVPDVKTDLLSTFKLAGLL